MCPAVNPYVTLCTCRLELKSPFINTGKADADLAASAAGELEDVKNMFGLEGFPASFLAKSADQLI